MRFRIAFLGVFAGMLLNFAIWVAVGWLDVNMSKPVDHILGMVVVAAIFSLPPLVGIVGLSRLDTISESGGNGDE